MTNILQLHKTFTPNNYQLRLTIDRPGRVFSGTVIISGELAHDDTAVLLHSHGLKINAAAIDDANASATIDEQNHHLTLQPGEPLKAGAHLVRVDFEGTITDPMQGLYPCYFKLDGKDEELVATQFETHHAREVFPCIDEPAAKATFDLTLTTETGVTVVSNTPVKTQTEANERLTTTFTTTPVMSTYLLAWVVGKLGYTEAKTKDGVIVRAYSTPDKVEQTSFARDVAIKTLEYYNDYFALPYPLSKCDMIALPDFSSGAMENWGCVTYRESCMLVDEKNTSAATRQSVADVVAHELAHQWFGNLVTMQWWNDLWLNESFATWISFLARDHLFPDWKVWTQFFTDESIQAFRRDALASVQKVQQEVHHPDEIRTLFDPSIVYAKGANLLHMLHAYLGSDGFRDGLRIYLKRHQYQNAVTDDLWAALSEASGKNVSAFMQPWTSQSGHPVVKVDVSDSSATLSQHRFYVNPKEARQDDPTLWPVPLFAGNLPADELLSGSTVTTALPQADKPLRLNQGRYGFYLTAYPAGHMARLAGEVAAGRLAVVDRLGMLSDSHSLARAGQQSAVQMLQLLEAYAHETAEPVWVAIADHVGAFKMLINDDPELKPLLRRFVALLAKEQFDRLGWERKPDESYQDQLLRPTIIGLMCYSEAPSVIEHALQLFAQANKPSDVLSDLRGVIFATAAKHGGEAEFKKLLDWYRATSSAEERINITAGLTSTTKPDLVKQELALLTTNTIKLQDLFYWFAYLIRSRHAKEATWQWLHDNWAWITRNFGSDMDYIYFPRFSASAFSTAGQLRQYKAFFGSLLSVRALERTIRQGIEDIEGRVLWRERDAADIADYLKKST